MAILKRNIRWLHDAKEESRKCNQSLHISFGMGSQSLLKLISYFLASRLLYQKPVNYTLEVL